MIFIIPFTMNDAGETILHQKKTGAILKEKASTGETSMS
jgi:hypothetical protein